MPPELYHNGSQTIVLVPGRVHFRPVILNHGQVTWTTPELAPPLLTTTPHQREDVSALDRFNVHRFPTRRVFSGAGLELVARQATIRYLYHSATAAAGSQVAAIREISRSCLDPNDFTVLNCIVKGHASLSTPSLRLRLCSRFTLLAT
ncbi:uncharacterized protein TNCV_3499471 [Trichonephila clavipes]|nr:uncharacterized protein TNCV_3499471 [Trichonephila clavipes]